MFGPTNVCPQKKRARAKPVRAETFHPNPCARCAGRARVCWEKLGRGLRCYPCAKAKLKCSLHHTPGLMGTAPAPVDNSADSARIAEGVERTAEGVERTAESMERAAEGMARIAEVLERFEANQATTSDHLLKVMRSLWAQLGSTVVTLKEE
jgi:hypothetical protein